MLLLSGSPFKCHEEVLFLQPMIPPTKRFDIFFPLTERCSEGLARCVQIFLYETNKQKLTTEKGKVPTSSMHTIEHTRTT